MQTRVQYRGLSSDTRAETMIAKGTDWTFALVVPEGGRVAVVVNNFLGVLAEVDAAPTDHAWEFSSAEGDPVAVGMANVRLGGAVLGEALRFRGR